MTIGSFLDVHTTRFNHQKAEVCETLADSTLFYCSSLFGIHYKPSSQQIITLSGTVFYHKYVYVILIYNYIYCHTHEQ